MKRLLFLLVITGFLASCNKSDERRIEQNDMILEYLTENNIADAIEIDESGVYYRITEEGNGGDFPTLNSTVRVFYKGYLMDGTVFDQRVEGVNDYLESSLRDVVYGWQLAIPKFNKGTKGEIFVPSHAGYGARELPGIPSHSILIFEVHLFNFF